jgi:formate-dependent nitrite reductase membrane component NrfD
MRIALAAVFYLAAFVFLYAGFALPGYEEISTGWPHSHEGIMAALFIINGLAAKLAGHVLLLSATNAR